MNTRLFLNNSRGRKAPSPPPSARDAGPSTNGFDDSSAPPPYHLEKFRLPVGGKVPQNLFVSAPQLKVHLGLLRAFRELRDGVTDLETNPDACDKLPSLAKGLEPQERWTWFLELALERWAPCSPQLGHFSPN